MSIHRVAGVQSSVAVYGLGELILMVPEARSLCIGENIREVGNLIGAGPLTSPPCSDRAIAAALAYLETLPPGARSWSDLVADRYQERLENLGDMLLAGALLEVERQSIVVQTSGAIMPQRWRPEAHQIVAAAAHYASPIPSVDDAWEEVHFRKRNHRHYRRRDPDRPYTWVMFEPEWSHPLISRAVRVLGGWGELVSGETQYQSGGTVGAFRHIYERSASEWLGHVMEQLWLPPARRAPQWFPLALAASQGLEVARPMSGVEVAAIEGARRIMAQVEAKNRPKEIEATPSAPALEAPRKASIYEFMSPEMLEKMAPYRQSDVDRLEDAAERERKIAIREEVRRELDAIAAQNEKNGRAGSRGKRGPR